MTKPEQFQGGTSGMNDIYEQIAVDNQSRDTSPSQAQERLMVALLDAATKSDNSLVLKEADFNKLGPKAPEVLREFGVKEIKISRNADGSDRLEATLASPKTIPQDPKIDGTHSITIGTKFSADLKRGADGSLTLDGVKGLTAKVQGPLGNIRNAEISKLELKSNADGTTELKSTGSVGWVSSSKTRTLPGEVKEKADLLLERLNGLRGNKQKFLEMPSAY